MTIPELKVIPDENGMRLDRWLRARFPGLHQGVIEKWARKGALRVDGKRCKPSDRVEEHQQITLPPDAVETAQSGTAPRVGKTSVISPAERERLQSWVIYQDQDLVALNKPPGIAVQGGTGQKRAIDGMAAAWRADDAADIPRLVHRLDLDTSGVLVLARTRQSAQRLAKLFSGRDIEKTYWALAIGVPKQYEGEINAPLIKAADEEMGGYQRMRIDTEEGKSAITRYRVLEGLGKALSLVELLPLTGRTHQLRAHMAAIGHPILGDPKYGGMSDMLAGLDLTPPLCLHARRLAIPRENPKAKPLILEAKLPAHMVECLKALGIERV